MPPWASLHQYYGMTESCGAATGSVPGDRRPEDWASGRASSAGRAGSVTELRIAYESGCDVPTGEVGEILLRGPIVSPGYWRRPEEIARTFRDGWLHTGDAGRLDEQVYLYVVDRIKDMIVTGGENVYSAEVENAPARHPAVAACAVIGIPHERWGKAVHAVVVLRPGEQPQEDANDVWRSAPSRRRLPPPGAGPVRCLSLAAGDAGRSVRPAVPPTRWRARWPIRYSRAWASPWWWRTSPAPAARSPTNTWPAPRRTATRCCWPARRS